MSNSTPKNNRETKNKTMEPRGSGGDLFSPCLNQNLKLTTETAGFISQPINHPSTLSGVGVAKNLDLSIEVASG